MLFRIISHAGLNESLTNPAPGNVPTRGPISVPSPRAESLLGHPGLAPADKWKQPQAVTRKRSAESGDAYCRPHALTGTAVAPPLVSFKAFKATDEGK